MKKVISRRASLCESLRLKYTFSMYIANCDRRGDNRAVICKIDNNSVIKDSVAFKEATQNTYN